MLGRGYTGILTGVQMNIFQQVKQALVRFPRKLTSIRLWGAAYDNAAMWSTTSQEALVRDGFQRYAVLYAAIMYKARCAQSVPLVAYTGTRAEPQPLDSAHPLARFCDRPNPRMSFSEMAMLNSVYLNLFGNSYTVFIKTSTDIVAYPLRPDYVRHVYDNGDLAGYLYCPTGGSIADGTPILSDMMMHVKLPDPGDPYAGFGPGMSPIWPAAQSIDVDNAATAFLKMFFDNGAMPLGLITTEQQIDNDTADMLKDRWHDTYGGHKNWSDTVVLGAGATYQRVGATLQELDMTILDARNEGRAAMVLGVPLTLIESRPQMVASTYNNKQSDREMFWQDTMLPEMNMSDTEYQYYLRGDDGSFCAYDYSQVPALIEVRMRRAAIYLAGWDGGAVLRNEARAALALPPLPGGDVLKLSLSNQYLPAGEAPQPTSETGAAAASDEETAEATTKARAPRQRKGRAFSNEQKALHWYKFDKKAQEFEPEYASAANEAFEYDRRNVMARVAEAREKAYRLKQTVDWQPVMLSVLDYIGTDSQGKWREIFAPVFAKTVMENGVALNDEYGMEFDVRNLPAEEWFQDYVMTFSDEISTTSADELKALLAKGQAEGWSVPEMEKQMGILFQQWMNGNGDAAAFAGERIPPHRRELIARDQTLRASNAGAQALYVDWGAPMKEWLATQDARTRDAHSAAAGQQRPINEPYGVGGQALMYPGDPAGRLDNVIQCRCQSLAIFPE